jgi:hypothetical protein
VTELNPAVEIELAMFVAAVKPLAAVVVTELNPAPAISVLDFAMLLLIEVNVEFVL